MIAKVTRGRAFTGLARYLETGREGNNPDRVAWTEARNLPTSDPHTTSLIMRATAAQSACTQKPAYHISLSFDPDDAVDRATMVQVADRLMNDLGIREHQALIVAHGDTRHPHLHVMINRVHPETFRAWDPKNDYRQIERSLREQEGELSLRAVPGHHYRLEGHERVERTEARDVNGQRQQAGKRRPAEQVLPLTEAAAARARVEAFVRDVIRDLHEANSLDDLRQRMIGKGFWGHASVPPHSPADHFHQDLQRLGGHHVVRTNNEPRPGERVDGNTAEAANATRSASERERETGAHAESAPNRTAQRSTNDQTTRVSRRETANPDGSGPPRPRSTQEVPVAGRSDGVQAAESDRVRAGPRDPGRARSDALDPRLDGVRRIINSLVRRIQLERTRDTTSDDLDRARVRMIPLTAQRAQARQASERFRTALAEVYRDPVIARRAFHARAEQIGDRTAAAELARRPQSFGQLRGTQVGPVRSTERAAALNAVPKLEHLGSEYLGRVREAWANRAEYRQARATVVHLERRIKTLDGELDRSPKRAQLEQRLARQLRELETPHRRALHRSLPIPHRRLVAAATRIGREFAHEQGHER